MIAENIREYLKANGITQEYIAKKTGMTKQAVSSSLCGARKLSADEYVSICEALGVSPNKFAEGITG